MSLKEQPQTTDPISYARTIISDIELTQLDQDREAKKIFDDIVSNIAKHNYTIEKEGISEVLEMLIPKTPASNLFTIQHIVNTLFESESEQRMYLVFQQTDLRIYSKKEDIVMCIGALMCCLPGCLCVAFLGKEAIKVRVRRY